MPNNRQWASIFWITAMLIWVLIRRDTRSSARDVLSAALSAKILGPLGVFVVWILGLVYLASQVGLWGAERVADSVFWFITAGLILFGRFDKVGRENGFVRRTALATLEVSALVQVLSEVFVLNLAVELVLQPVFALFVCVSVVAAQNAEHRQVKMLVDGLILIGSLLLLVYVVVSIVSNWDALDKRDLLQQFALPVWMTMGALPYIYLLGLAAAYEVAFNRINWNSSAGWSTRTRAKLVLVTSFLANAREVTAFSGSWQFKLAAATSFRDGRRVVGEFRQAQQQAASEVEEKVA